MACPRHSLKVGTGEVTTALPPAYLLWTRKGRDVPPAPSISPGLCWQGWRNLWGFVPNLVFLTVEVFRLMDCGLYFVSRFQPEVDQPLLSLVKYGCSQAYLHLPDAFHLVGLGH